MIYIHQHRALCEYGAIKTLYFTINRSALESISTQHNAELEQAREQASGGGALTEECRRRVEEVERLLRENTEVRSVCLCVVCVYICLCVSVWGGAQTEECRRRLNERERLLLENTVVRHAALLSLSLMLDACCWMPVYVQCMSPSASLHLFLFYPSPVTLTVSLSVRSSVRPSISDRTISVHFQFSFEL